MYFCLRWHPQIEAENSFLAFDCWLWRQICLPFCSGHLLIQGYYINLLHLTAGYCFSNFLAHKAGVSGFTQSLLFQWSHFSGLSTIKSSLFSRWKRTHLSTNSVPKWKYLQGGLDLSSTVLPRATQVPEKTSIINSSWFFTIIIIISLWIIIVTNVFIICLFRN